MLKDYFSTNISLFIIFGEGLLSFFSPCVIPLIPVYIGYLAGNAKQKDENGIITYRRKKVFLHTVFFVLGISAAFFLLGIAFTSLGTFFKDNRLLFTRIGGAIIIALGLIQIGFLDIKFFQKERKLPVNFVNRQMNPLTALILGFTFSFAWTPCVGPALSSVLIMASGTGSALTGNLLVLVYTAGFVIPFLLLGLFTAQVLNFLKKHQNLLKYTVKAGGILLILIGIMIFTGWMNRFSSYLNSFQASDISNTQDSGSSDALPDDDSNNSPVMVPDNDNDSNDNNSNSNNNDSNIGSNHNNGNNNIDSNHNDNNSGNTSSNDSNNGNNNDRNGDSDNSNNSDGTSKEGTSARDNKDEENEEVTPAYDFTLTDQNGSRHTLSDYKGKIVFINFWATWCPPCKKELPDVEYIYQEFGQNAGDVIIIGITNPVSKDYPDNADVSVDEIKDFLDENDYTFPVLFDETGEVLKDYRISAFPTTFMIDKNGNIFGYAPGQLTKDIMHNIIQNTMDSTN